MKYSVLSAGDVLEIEVKETSYLAYDVMLGEENLGKIFRVRKTWSANPSKPHPLAPFEDIASSVGAVHLLVKIWRSTCLS